LQIGEKTGAFLSMNSRSFVLLLTGLFCLSGFAANAGTPLELSMKQMSKAFKALSLDLQQPQDANKADYLTLAATLKTATQKSRSLVPKKVATIPADQQDAMVKAYQKSIDDLSAEIDTLTQEIQAGKWDDARKELATINQQEDDGHKAFRIKK